MSELSTTPLTSWHQANGAKMAPFAGFLMPIQYAGGILAEHNQTREQAAVFDICHMGEFSIRGAGAKDALGRLVTHNLDTLQPGRCRYGFLLNDRGGVIDDLIVYCLGVDDYFLVVNGARVEIDRATLRAGLSGGVELEDLSEATAKIDLQGPLSFEVLQALGNELPGDWKSLKYFHFAASTFAGRDVRVSRTGYTGELGYELYLPAENALALWERLLADSRVAPAGLGARDTLRLEIGLPLYGQDLDTEHNPAEAGYGMLLKSPAEYTGKGKDLEIRERLVALAMDGRRAARHDNPVLLPSGERVGRVTSGSFAPSLGHAVALAYVAAEHAEADLFLVEAGRAPLEARRVQLPFYAKGTARAAL